MGQQTFHEMGADQVGSPRRTTERFKYRNIRRACAAIPGRTVSSDIMSAARGGACQPLHFVRRREISFERGESVI